MKKRWFLYEATALFGADQICKTYVEQNLDPEEEKRLTDRVVLRRAHNRGISFGILKDTPKAVLTLSVLAASIVTVIQVFSMFQRKRILRSVSLSALAAGAWSNTFDRFARGYVVDYIGFPCRKKKDSSVTYNFADFFIAMGAAGTLAGELFSSK